MVSAARPGFPALFAGRLVVPLLAGRSVAVLPPCVCGQFPVEQWDAHTVSAVNVSMPAYLVLGSGSGFSVSFVC